MKKNLTKYPGYPLIKTYPTPKMWFLMTDAVKRGYDPGFQILLSNREPSDFNGMPVPKYKWFARIKHKIAFIVKGK